MPILSGGEAVVQSLIAHDVKLIFGLPGVQNDHFFNAMYDARERIKIIHTRHEQGAAYMALGYALASGGVGVFSVVPGPGLLNTAAAIVSAYAVNARVLCLTGQIATTSIGREFGDLHEIPGQLEILRTLTKWAERVNSPAEAPMMVAEAFRQMNSGRPRPVALEVPPDVLEMRVEVDTEVPPPPTFAPPLDLDRIEEAAKLLGQAQNPLIWVGGGAQDSGADVLRLAELLQAPIGAFRNGLGVVDSRNDLSLSQQAAREYWNKADVVIAIGANMRTPLQRWGKPSSTRLIRIDVDPTTHNKFVRPDVSITARAQDALPQLLRAVERHNRKREPRAEETRALKTAWEQKAEALQPQLSYIKVMREELGEDGIFVDEMTQVAYVARMTMPVYKPHTYITSGYQGTLGYGFQTAIGVKVARPDVPVISVSGDGGFMFGVQELATAVQQRIPLVAIVYNNNQYGNVQMMQKSMHGGRVIATDLHNPDFVKLAESFGALGLRATNPEELRGAIRKGFAQSGPTLIDVPIGDVPSIDRFR
ncbi:MAG: acetolactate synthase [Chloroflexi bacterium]|nr:acetolactate synthase [Chloroflexota bacterium]